VTSEDIAYLDLLGAWDGLDMFQHV